MPRSPEACKGELNRVGHYNKRRGRERRGGPVAGRRTCSGPPYDNLKALQAKRKVGYLTFAVTHANPASLALGLGLGKEEASEAAHATDEEAG